jgi:hypothetical protein
VKRRLYKEKKAQIRFLKFQNFNQKFYNSKFKIRSTSTKFILKDNEKYSQTLEAKGLDLDYVSCKLNHVLVSCYLKIKTIDKNQVMK